MSTQLNRSTKRLNESGHLNTILRGAGGSLGGKLFGGALKYVSTLVMAWILDLHTFGLFFLGLSIVNLTGNFVRLGLDNAAVRFVSIYYGAEDHQRLKGVIWQSILIPIVGSLLLGVALFLAADTIAVNAFHKPGLAHTLKFLSISMPFFAVMLIATFVTQGFKKIKYTVYIINIVQPLSAILLILFFVYVFSMRENGVLIAYVLSTVIASYLALNGLNRVYPEFLSKEIRPVFETSKLLKFSIPTFMAGLITMIIWNIDTIMLGYWRSSHDVGIYNATAKTALLAGLVGASFTPICQPIISNLYSKGEHQTLSDIYKVVTRWVFNLSLPVFIIISLFSTDILMVFGKEFVSGWPTLIILALTQTVTVSTGPTGGMLVMSGRQNIMLLNSIIVCIVDIILNYFLIQSYGAIGAAMATLMALILFNILMVAQIYHYFKTFPYSIVYLKTLAAFGSIAIVIYLLKHRILTTLPLAPRLGIFLLIAGTLFGAIILLLAKRDRNFFLSLRGVIAKNKECGDG